MKNKEKFLIVVMATLVESYSFVEMFTGVYRDWLPPFFFLLGVEPVTIYRVFTMWYIFFVCLSLFFSGNISEKLNGFGKYMLIRNYSKTKILLDQYLSIALKLLGFIVFQILVFYIMVSVLQRSLDLTATFLQIGQALLVYFLTFLTLFLVQMVLELYVSPQTSLLVVNMYVVFSVLLAGVLFKFERMQPLLYFLLPNFAMALRTDIRNPVDFTIHYLPAFCVLIILLSVVVVLSIQRIKSKDLY